MADKPVTRSRLLRHPWLMLGGLLLGAAALWIGLFVARFDLDDYRGQITAELANQLQLPVQLGQARLELRETGLALRFTDLQIGSPQTAVALQSRTVWLQLAWRGLLLGQPIFSKIVLDEPQLRITLGDSDRAESPAGQPAFLTDSSWLQKLDIRSIQMRRGILTVAWSDQDGSGRQFQLRDVTLDVGNLARASDVLFDLAGTLPGSATPPGRLTLKGSLRLPTAGPLSASAWDLTLTAKGADAAPLAALLPERYGIRASGNATLHLTTRGNLQEGAGFAGELTGTRLQVRPGRSHPQPIPIGTLQLAAEWQPTTDGHLFRQVTAQLDGLRLGGELRVQRAADRLTLHAALGAGTLPLATVVPWLSATALAQNGLVKNLRAAGDLELHAAALRVSVPTAGSGAPTVAFDQLRGTARRIAWTLPGGKTLELVSLPLQLAAGRWQITQGEARLENLPFRLTGVVDLHEGAPPTLTVDLQTDTDAGQLAGLWRSPLPPSVTLTGPVSLHGHIEGPLPELGVAVHADLSRVQGSYGERLTLPPTPGARWSGTGTLLPGKLRLDRGELTLPPVRGELRGEIDWSGAAVVITGRGTADLAEVSDLARQVPLLADLKLHGGLGVELAVTGPLETPEVHGSVHLHGVGMPMHHIIGDISAGRGTLQFTGRQLQGEQITALIGRSPVALQVNIPDLTAPRLALKVQAPAIRADELIFRSDARILRDLNGRVLIDGDGISFAPVNVRLDQGTRASIRGRVKSFDHPAVELDITGDYANVEEIIALWTDESPAAEAARKARHAATPPPQLAAARITVAAKQGDLFGMRFSEARAVIVPSNERLLLHPLDFKVGDGFCATQVLVDYAGERPLLRVSGHAENVDAYQIHNELLDRKSILRGTLRGDFYLQGELGAPGSKRFLSTSYGSIHFSVKDGVLRHSPVLSTIFSLLNVSQLFSLELPDVSTEGVPFTLLTGDLAFDRGQMRTENLLIESNAMNMSYVGQFDLVGNRLDLLAVVKPLGTIDKVVSNLPVAGWILGGEERALLTAQFKITGPAEDPEVEAIPVSAISKGILGIIQRTLSLPVKLIDDPAILWGQGGKKGN